jgi:DNA-binding PadR family transcriptional regulator
MWWNKFSKIGKYGGLKSIILYTLSERPKNGAEIMDSIETMTYGSWRPSPGSIYPMLGKMCDEMLIKKRDDGRYELGMEGFETMNFMGWGPAGKTYTVESIMTEMDSSLSYLADLPKEKLDPYKEKIERIAEKIQKLNASLQNK